MIKVNRPTGLIRYASENSIRHGIQKLFTNRVKAYSLVLVVLLSILITLLATRPDYEGTIMRFPGLTYQARPDGKISNLYSITLINKTFQPQSIHLSTEAVEMEVEIVGDSNWILPPQSKFEGRFFLVKDQKKVQIPQEKVLINLSAVGEVFESVETNFMAPVKKINN